MDILHLALSLGESVSSLGASFLGYSKGNTLIDFLNRKTDPFASVVVQRSPGLRDNGASCFANVSLLPVFFDLSDSADCKALGIREISFGKSFDKAHVLQIANSLPYTDALGSYFGDRWQNDKSPYMPTRALAAPLFGVGTRTYQHWMSETYPIAAAQSSKAIQRIAAIILGIEAIKDFGFVDTWEQRFVAKLHGRAEANLFWRRLTRSEREKVSYLMFLSLVLELSADTSSEKSVIDITQAWVTNWQLFDPDFLLPQNNYFVSGPDFDRGITDNSLGELKRSWTLFDLDNTDTRQVPGALKWSSEVLAMSRPDWKKFAAKALQIQYVPVEKLVLPAALLSFLNEGPLPSGLSAAD